MRALTLMAMLALPGAGALAIDYAEADFVAPRAILISPPSARAPSLVEATIEPTRHEVRFDDVFAAERWEQNFHLTARLPVQE